DHVADLVGDAGCAPSPLVIGGADRLLAAVALSTFPNTAAREPERVDPREALPDTARRAIAFIESNPDLDIGLADIARAAHVTPRALQLAFRRHLDTTPMTYLRRVRLDQAHLELLNAIPGDGLTVTEVAMRWGFANPSRFAQHYAAQYGEPPSHALRR
ncbi:MAG: helix-turn-helix transcriptional regulator, partial [Solirubrobacteraceae bacterium]